MPTLKLTKRSIDAISPSAKPVIYYDSELTGFCLKVLATGAKRWCVEYRSGAGGRSVGKTRMVLGSASKLTPDQARQSAAKILAAVALGQDPAGKRSRERAIPAAALLNHRSHPTVESPRIAAMARGASAYPRAGARLPWPSRSS